MKSLLFTLLYENRMVLHLNKLNPFTQGCFVPNLVEIGPAVLEMIFEFRQCIFAISKLSPFRRGRGPSFEQT